MLTKKAFLLAAEEVKYQASFNTDRKARDSMIAAFVGFFQAHKFANRKRQSLPGKNPAFDADRFRDACEGSFSPTRWERLRNVKRDTKSAQEVLNDVFPMPKD